MATVTTGESTGESTGLNGSANSNTLSPLATEVPGASKNIMARCDFFGHGTEITNQHSHFHWRGFGQYTLGLCFLKLLVTGIEIQLAEISQQANKNWGIKATRRVIHRDNAVVWVLRRPFVRQSLNQVSLGGSGLGTLNSTLQT